MSCFDLYPNVDGILGIVVPVPEMLSFRKEMLTSLEHFYHVLSLIMFTLFISFVLYHYKIVYLF